MLSQNPQIKKEKVSKIKIPKKFIKFSKGIESFFKIPFCQAKNQLQLAASHKYTVREKHSTQIYPSYTPTFIPRFLSLKFLAAAPSDFEKLGFPLFEVRSTLPFNQTLPQKNYQSLHIYGPPLKSKQNLSGNQPLLQIYDFNHLILLKTEILIKIDSQKILNRFLQQLETTIMGQKNKNVSELLKFFHFKISFSGQQFFIQFSKAQELIGDSQYWSKFGFNLYQNKNNILLEYFLETCKVKDLINLSIQEKTMFLQFGEVDQSVMHEKLFNTIKKNDKDGSFFDYLQRNGFNLLKKEKKITEEMYFPIKRQKKILWQTQMKEIQKTVIYQEEKQNNQEFFIDFPPPISPLCRSISQPVQEKQKNEYIILKKRQLLRINRVLENNIE